MDELTRDRLADALERIAASLERMAPVLTGVETNAGARASGEGPRGRASAPPPTPTEGRAGRLSWSPHTAGPAGESAGLTSPARCHRPVPDWLVARKVVPAGVACSRDQGHIGFHSVAEHGGVFWSGDRCGALPPARDFPEIDGEPCELDAGHDGPHRVRIGEDRGEWQWYDDADLARIRDGDPPPLDDELVRTFMRPGRPDDLERIAGRGSVIRYVIERAYHAGTQAAWPNLRERAR